MSRMNNARLQWVESVDGYSGWLLEYEDDNWMQAHRTVAGDRKATRDELVPAVSQAMRGDYIDGKVTVLRPNKPDEVIVVERGLAQ